MKFLITAKVKSAKGFQLYTVVAKDEKEALRKHEEGLSEFDSENIEVTELGKITIEPNE